MMFTALKAGSTALAGFGLDSLIEIFASVVVVWQLKGVADDRERRALRLIGTAFFLLAAYVLGQSVWTLATRSHPAPSPLGMAWLVITVVAMALLAYGKLVTGRALQNVVLRTEARVTLIDAALAVAVLIEPSPSLWAPIRGASWSRPWAWAGVGSASGTTRNQRLHPAEHRNVRMGRQIP
ncbi:MAG TPA: hypothetical protein VH353_04550 [Caulobacteraceae bacterium]|jgi:divalent metal cation (Fe/Co/Zn/Cd) transporter|nr:hypothetical protein [Caulobacteraceae bacterium]